MAWEAYGRSVCGLKTLDNLHEKTQIPGGVVVESSKDEEKDPPTPVPVDKSRLREGIPCIEFQLVDKPDVFLRSDYLR
jgi:hypothetical protein